VPGSSAPPRPRWGARSAQRLDSQAHSLADTFSIQDAAVACTGACLQLVEVGQPGVAAQVAGGVDHGLDAHRPAVFEVLLDPRVLVEDVDDHALVVMPIDRGPKHPLGVAADLAAEDDLNVAGAAKVEVVGDQRLEEPTGVAGGVEHDGAGDLDLPHRALPPVAGIAVGLAKGQRQQRQPPLGEHIEGVRDALVMSGLGAASDRGR
jgi:hypothetical protein